MNESQWLTVNELRPMVEFLRDKAGVRKQRLFAIACCRSVWHDLTDEERRYVESAEQYVEGNNLHDAQHIAAPFTGDHLSHWKRCYEKYKYLERTHDCDPDYKQEIEDSWDASSLASRAFHRSIMVRATTRSNALVEVSTTYRWEPYTEAGLAVEAAPIIYNDLIENPCDLLREIFGNPFRSLQFDELPKESVAIKIAREIYVNRDFDRMQMLADVLENSDFSTSEMVAHCRNDREHVRGCWVIDALIGRS